PSQLAELARSERRAGLADARAGALVQSPREHRARAGCRKFVPGGNPARPQVSLSPRSDAGDMLEGPANHVLPAATCPEAIASSSGRSASQNGSRCISIAARYLTSVARSGWGAPATMRAS